MVNHLYLCPPVSFMSQIFNLPRAHSITLRRLHKVRPKYCSSSVLPPLPCSFIKMTLKDKLGLPIKIHPKGPFLVQVFFYMLVLYRLSEFQLASNFKKSASCILPGHLTNTSIKQIR